MLEGRSLLRLKKSNRRRSARGLLLVYLAISGCVFALDGRRLPTLTSIRQIRKLSKEEADRHYPVHLRAIVTFFYAVAARPGRQGLRTNLFVQDSTGGNWVKVNADQPRLKAGDVIDLTGHTEESGFAPDVVDPRWTVIGQAPLPVPLKAEFGALASTRNDSLLVEVDGIVQAVDSEQDALRLDIAMETGHVTVYIPKFGLAVPASGVRLKE